MHKVVVTSLLLSALLAGCTDEDVKPAASAPASVDGTYTGLTERHVLARLSWGDDQQGVPASRAEALMTIDVPGNLTQLRLEARRMIDGVERQPAHLTLEPVGGAPGSITFPLAHRGPLGDYSAGEVFAEPGDAPLVHIRYVYDVQPQIVSHNLELVLLGDLPLRPPPDA